MGPILKPSSSSSSSSSSLSSSSCSSSLRSASDTIESLSSKLDSDQKGVSKDSHTSLSREIERCQHTPRDRKGLASQGNGDGVQTAVTASRGNQRGDVQIRKFLHHNGAPRDLVFDLTLTHERWGDTDDPSKLSKLRHPANINKPLQEAASQKPTKYQSDYANDRRISFLPAVSSTSGRIDAEFLRLLFLHAHRESEEFFRLMGQLWISK